VWTWSNFLHDQTAAGKRPLRVNFDETSVRLFQPSRDGHLSLPAQRLLRSARSLRRRATLAEARTMLTLACFVCDDAELQPLLPQILVASKKVMPAEEASALRRGLPPGVLLWREERAWTSSALMVRFLGALRAALGPALLSRQVILSADAFKAHASKPVWRAAARLGFFYFLIPAKMTWALQPLDTHVFSVFKRRLEEAAQAAAASSPDGRLGRARLVQCVCETVEAILRGRGWARAFEDTGLAGCQASVSPRTRAKLGDAEAPPAGRGLPSLPQLLECFPRRAWIPIDEVFLALTPGKAEAPRPKVPRRGLSPPPPAAADAAAPWKHRLRSSSRLLEASPASSLPEPPCLPPPPPPAPASSSHRPELRPERRPALPTGRPLLLPGLPRAPRPRLTDAAAAATPTSSAVSKSSKGSSAS